MKIYENERTKFLKEKLNEGSSEAGPPPELFVNDRCQSIADKMYIAYLTDRQMQAYNYEIIMCNKYNKRVYHYTYHPALIMLDECDYKGDKWLHKTIRVDEFVTYPESKIGKFIDNIGMYLMTPKLGDKSFVWQDINVVEE